MVDCQWVECILPCGAFPPFKYLKLLFIACFISTSKGSSKVLVQLHYGCTIEQPVRSHYKIKCIDCEIVYC